MLNEEQQAELLERFLASREGDEWQGFVEATKKALEAAPDAETVLVPAAFLREAIADSQARKGGSVHFYRSTVFVMLVPIWLRTRATTADCSMPHNFEGTADETRTCR